MDKVLHGLKFVNVLCYLDDVCIFSSTFDKHLQDIEDVLQRFQKAGLKLGPSKCKFAVTKGVFLGHEISDGGIRPPPNRIECIRNYPSPTTRKELERALGLLNWFRKFIPNFSVLAYPLHKLLRKGTPFIWDNECECSFNSLKSALVQSNALSFPRFDLEFRLAVDTCSKGIGYMLYQIHENGVKHVVRFGSKGLSKWQQSYGPTKLDLLGVVTNVLDCASFLRGRHFVIECDHQALKSLFQKQLKGAIYERWLAILQQFDCDIQWKSASEMVVPDCLSRAIQYPEVLTYSPEEDDTFFPYVADNPTRVCLHNSSDKADVQDLPLCVNKMERLQHQSPLYDGDTEDNVLNDLPRTFRRKRKLNRSKNSHKLKNHNYLCSSPHQHSFDQVSSESSLIDQIDCKTKANIDSNSQTEGTLLMPHPCIGTDTQPSSQMEDAPTNNKSIGDSNSPVPVDLHVTLPKELSTSAVPHSHSSMTDTAMDSASNSDPQLKCYEVLTKLNMTPESIYNCQKTDPDLQPILDYFEKGQLPKQQKLARRVLLQHSDFTVLDGMLFQNRLARSVRTKSQRQYQLVIPKSMIKFVLELCHDSPLAGHGGIQDTVERIRQHFFFTNLVSIVGDYVRSCHQCQSRKLTTAHFKNRITSYPTPKEPFSVWEIDPFLPHRELILTCLLLWICSLNSYLPGLFLIRMLSQSQKSCLRCFLLMAFVTHSSVTKAQSSLQK